MSSTSSLRKCRTFLAVSAAVLGAGVPLRGQTQLPSTVYIWPMGNTNQNSMMASLAGIVNRTTNGEVLLSPDDGTPPNPRFWLDQLQASYPQVQSQVQSQPSFYLNQYKSKITGYVYYDTSVNPDSLNIATSIAGVTDAIVVDPNTRLTAILAGLSQVADARSMTYASAYQTYGSQFNKDMLFHQASYLDYQLRDYAVMNQGFVYYSSPTQLNPYASNQNHQGRVFGWADSEQDIFTQASQNNQQVVASNYSWSASTTSKWKVPVQPQVYHAPANVATSAGKHYVAFVMSDGDNEQWLTNGFATDPKWYGSPYRGNFNMTWDFSPTLKDMNPVAMNYIYSHASNGTYHDSFVTAGGAGTTFPSLYPDTIGLASNINSAMASADQRVISILDPTYDTTKLFPVLDQSQVMGMMFKTYSDFYKGRNGALQWHNGKPILSVKYSLWDGADTAQSLANALNSSTHRDPVDDSASYDIINVHPWSTSGPDGTGTGDPMSNLWQLVQWLDPNKVQVVTLEEMMVQLRNHFGTPVTGAQVTGTWTRNANSAWETRTNWTGAAPNFVDAMVNFGTAITGDRLISINTPTTAGTLNFSSPFAYSISGSPGLTMDVTTGMAAINVTAGNPNIYTPLTLADDTTINVAAAGSKLSITSLQDSSRTITKTGEGTLEVNRIRASVLHINEGIVRVSTSGGASAISMVGNLQIDPGTALDLSNNDLVVNSGSFSTIQQLVFQGYRTSADPTATGIISTTGQTAAGNPILALFDNALIGAPDYPFGSGQTISNGAIVGKYTYFGDTNWDGQVTADDYGALDANFGATNVPAGTAWFIGDTNLDGMVSADDYGALDANFGLGVGNPLSAQGAAAVPEPAEFLTIIAAGAIFLRRRR